MSFFAVLFALLIEQLKPLPRGNVIHDALTSWMRWTGRNFDAGREHHAWVVWAITCIVPSLPRAKTVTWPGPREAAAGLSSSTSARAVPVRATAASTASAPVHPLRISQPIRLTPRTSAMVGGSARIDEREPDRLAAAPTVAQFRPPPRSIMVLPFRAASADAAVATIAESLGADTARALANSVRDAKILAPSAAALAKNVSADERALGKPIASDLREGKVTLPIIYLLERGGAARDIVESIVRERDVTREQWAELKQLLADSQSVAKARRQAEHYASVALQHLAAFPAAPEKDALLALPEYVLSRDR